MEETVNQVQAGQNSEEQARTFTQAELDKIVADRLTRERAKYADYDALVKKAARLDKLEEATKTDLQKATERANALQAELDALKGAEQLRTVREKVSKETGVPIDILTAQTEEDCAEQAKRIMAFAKPGTYPQMRDGGEAKSGRSKESTRDQFAKWFNSQT